MQILQMHLIVISVIIQAQMLCTVPEMHGVNVPVCSGTARPTTGIGQGSARLNLAQGLALKCMEAPSV